MPLKKSLIKIIKILGIGFTIIYPFVVFFALEKRVALPVLILLLLTAAGISFIRNKNVWMFVCVLLLGLGLTVFNNDIFLKLYPVLMNICVGLMFALSLRDTPLIERFAKKMGYNLDNKQKQYARKSTRAWAIFMFCLGAISLATVFLSTKIWTVFNGLISYILIAMMMTVEFVIRKKVTDVHTDK